MAGSYSPHLVYSLGLHYWLASFVYKDPSQITSLMRDYMCTLRSRKAEIIVDPDFRGILEAIWDPSPFSRLCCYILPLWEPSPLLTLILAFTQRGTHGFFLCLPPVWVSPQPIILTSSQKAPVNTEWLPKLGFCRPLLTIPRLPEGGEHWPHIHQCCFLSCSVCCFCRFAM